MGVMPCSRDGCDHILCDCYSAEFGYICWDCRYELIEFLKRRRPGNIRAAIREFMDGEAKHQKDEAYDEYVEKSVDLIFPNTRERDR